MSARPLHSCFPADSTSQHNMATRVAMLCWDVESAGNRERGRHAGTATELAAGEVSLPDKQNHLLHHWRTGTFALHVSNIVALDRGLRTVPLLRISAAWLARNGRR